MFRFWDSYTPSFATCIFDMDFVPSDWIQIERQKPDKIGKDSPEKSTQETDICQGVYSYSNGLYICPSALWWNFYVGKIAGHGHSGGGSAKGTTLNPI